jgi:hypothetical protein
MRTSTTRLAAGFLGVLVGVVQIVGFAQSNNPQVGTWKANIAKSKFTVGPALTSGTTKIEAAGAGVKFTVDNMSADGSKNHWEFTANYDGKDNPVTGNSPYGDVVALTRVDANTTRMVNKKGGKVTATITSVVSSDGKTRTVTIKGTNAMGQAVDGVTVYERQ